MFSRGMEKQHRAVMGQNYNIINIIYKNKLFYYIDLLPFTNLLELLVINHSSFEGKNIFVPRWLKVSHVLVVLQLAWLCTLPQLKWIWRSSLAFCLDLLRVSRYLWHSSKWSCWVGCVFQYTSGLEVLAYSINNDFNYVITMLQSYIHPELLGCSNL